MKKTIGIIVLVLLVSNIGFAEKNVRISGGATEDFSAKQTLSESEINDLKIKAENNDINSQIELYYYYSASELYEDAFYWIEQAAIQGDPIAQNNLGYSYDNGLGIDINKKLAYEWFVKAAEQNQVHAITTLAAYYLDGEVVEQSYVKAFEFYKKAVQQNFDRAIYGLGLMHEKGQGTKFDYKKAKEFYLKADELGHPIAKTRYDALEGGIFQALPLAFIYSKGSLIELGIPIDLAEAAFWFKIAEFKGGGNYEYQAFEEVLNNISPSQYTKASNRFEYWKKSLGFVYDKETLKDVTPYLLHHNGTAFYINEDTLLSNKHVIYQDEKFVSKCDRIIGFVPNEARYEVYKHYNTTYLPKEGDVEILKSTTKSKSYISISSSELKNGSDIFVIGFPHGDEVSKYPKITRGIINSTIGINNNFDGFIFDAISYPGSSGSPVLNKSGLLVGILYGGYVHVLRDSEGEIQNTISDPNESYGIKSSYLINFLDINNISYKKLKKRGWNSRSREFSVNFGIISFDSIQNIICNVCVSLHVSSIFSPFTRRYAGFLVWT